MKRILLFTDQNLVSSTKEFTYINCSSIFEILKEIRSTKIDVLILQNHDEYIFNYLLDQYQSGLIESYGTEIVILTNNPDQKFIETIKEYKIKYALDVSEIEQRLESIIRFIKPQNQNKKSIRKAEFSIPLSKRIFDIFFASLALLFLSPLLIVIIILIRLESKGPVFYAAKRVGARYKIFDFYKFRSMRVDADKMIDSMKDLNQYTKNVDKTEQYYCMQCLNEGNTCKNILYKDGKSICETNYLQQKSINKENAFVKFKDDPRITKIGSFIRRTSIDELPQLINILKGDMSIVGNRPLPLYEAEQLTSDKYAKRFLAPAGLTGLWQVSKRGQSDMSAEERKLLDNQYAEDFSFVGDLGIIINTVPALFQKENV